MASFEELGLGEELLHILEDAELESPTALQEAVIPVLRRGGNLVARASTGAGKTLAYGLGVLDRLKPATSSAEEVEEVGEEDGFALQLLVLVPTAETAERVALALFPFAQAAELRLTTSGGTWATPATEAEVLITTPAAAMQAVRGSALKLDAVEAVVIDGASAVEELGGWTTVDTLLDHIPRDAQRILISSALTDEIEDLVDRRIKRALRYPTEPAVQPHEPVQTTGSIGYVLVPEHEKLEMLAQLLGSRDTAQSAPAIFCRTDERAAELAEALTVRGFLVGELDDPDTDAAILAAGTTRNDLAEEGVEPGQTISYDVPPDEAGLLNRHRGDSSAVVLLQPRELPHLREIARRAHLEPRAIPVLGATDSATAELAAFRRELVRALAEEDLSAQMLVLEPLFEEHSAAEIAAAAAALLRRRRAAEPAAQPTVAATVNTATMATAAPATPSQQQSEAGPPPATWARLYVGVGERDGIRPGDLVGAIAGEANIPGSKVGKINIRDSFSIVEVEADVAAQVIAAVNGTTIKGRSARVDYDRGGDRGGKTGGSSRPPVRRSRGPEDGSRPPVRRPPRD